MKNLFILKKIIEDKNLSDMAFTVWCGLRNIMAKDVKEYFVTYNMIGYSLFGRVPVRCEVDAIKKGFNELIELNYVKVIASYSKHEFVVDLSDLYYEHGMGYFSNLTAEEMKQILNLDCKQDKYKLLRYFTCQVGTFNQSLEGKYKGKIGGMGLENFVSMLGYSKTSIISYNKVLLKKKILFVHTHGDFYKAINDNGQSFLRELPNTYARYIDKDLALEYMKKYQGWKANQTESTKRNIKANHNRAVAQQLIAFQKGKEYDINTIREMYVYADTKNMFAESEYENNIKKGYSPEEPNYIDMSIFDDYLLDICC